MRYSLSRVLKTAFVSVIIKFLIDKKKYLCLSVTYEKKFVDKKWYRLRYGTKCINANTICKKVHQITGLVVSVFALFHSFFNGQFQDYNP